MKKLTERGLRQRLFNIEGWAQRFVYALQEGDAERVDQCREGITTATDGIVKIFKKFLDSPAKP